jgi:predicted nucleotidyltransferase
MSKSLLDLSEKSEQFQPWLGVFKVIADVANECGIEYFVAGALARDVILYYGYDIEARAATRDIDFGVKVAGWDQFEILIDGLKRTGLFAQGNQYHRLDFNQGDTSPLPVDIVPFGSISSNEASIAWPPNNEVIMNVLGFNEAFEHCTLIRLSRDPVIEIPFCSVAGLALMKLIAWNDGYTGNTSDIQNRLMKDSSDLLLIITNYLKAGNRDRLIDGEDADIVDIFGDDFNYELAGARLLGRDIARIATGKSRDVVLEILGRETNFESQSNKLVDNMVGSVLLENITFDLCMGLLNEIKHGMQETSPT